MWTTKGRIFISPGQAYLHGTQKELPPSVIPLEYRNDEESIRAILNGEIMEPWGRSTKILKGMLGDLTKTRMAMEKIMT